jgi:hypothetical protein
LLNRPHFTVQELPSDEPMPLPDALLLLIAGGMVTCTPSVGGTSFGAMFGPGV